MKPVLVLGGYGNFGKRIVELLARQDVPVVIAGRNKSKAADFADKLGKTCVSAEVVDIGQELASALERLDPAVVVNTCGPFQGLDYAVPRLCIQHKVPYIDLADGREYVAGFSGLDEEARRQNVLAVSGASTVPALTAAVLDHYKQDFKQISELDFGIAPGQQAERGLATTKAILGYVGKALKPCAGYPYRYGWQDIHAEFYPGIGRRWMANCEVPDLDLLPPRYGIERIRFSAGMELPVIHFGIWSLSWAVRTGLPIDLKKFARPLLTVANWFNSFGSADGGMHIVMAGTGTSGAPLKLRWHIVARKGDGPYVPAVPAVILAKKIAKGEISETGALACMGLFSLDDYLAELSHLNVECFEDRS